MRVARALGDMKFVLIGAVFVVVAISWVYQTYTYLSDLISDISLDPELSRGVIGLRLSATGRQIGISFLLLAIGLSFVGWGIADYSQRSSNRTTKLMVGGLYMIGRRLEKLESVVQRLNGSKQVESSREIKAREKNK